MDTPTNQCDLFSPALKEFCQNMRKRRIQTDGALAFSAALVVILVGLGACSHRYRRHFLVRFLLVGASTVFLPFVSYVVSVNTGSRELPEGVERCYRYGPAILLMWAALVPMVGINNATLVIASDEEGRNTGLLWERLVQLIWTLYLIIIYMQRKVADNSFLLFILITCAVGLAEILLNICAFRMAWRSFALGRRNPRLIAGYMDQLQNIQEDELVNMLVVMGEDKQEIEEGPRGYRFRDRENRSLVTIGKVRNTAFADCTLSSSTPQLQDLCLSFSLFKLLRRRFAGCPIVEEGSSAATHLVHNALFNNHDPERMIRIIADELSFVRDFYYSFVPISYSRSWSPMVSILVSLIVGTYCLTIGVYWFWGIRHEERYRRFDYTFPQIYCKLTGSQPMTFGNVLFGVLLTFFLLLAVVLAKAWAITSCFCSNWTKVTLVCSYITNTSRQQSPCFKGWISRLLQCRSSVMKNWGDKMGQTCILESQQKKRPLFVHLRRALQLTDQTNRVNIPIEVKAAILDSFTRSSMRLSNGIAFLQQTRIGNDVLWACKGEGTSDVILVWHIATSIFEIRYLQDPADAYSSKDRIVATHLSRYCVYLLSSFPELLPDDKAWSKKLYQSVKKIVKPILKNGSERPLQYELLIGMFAEKLKDSNLLGRGVELGKHLVDKSEDEKMGWEILAGFWSEMILYIAPSSNIKAHGMAIARGGELITILWALLTHAGIISRTSTSSAV